MDDRLWHILQTTDTAFPVGGFAHSYGLEGLFQADAVTTPDALAEFLNDAWLPILTHVDFPIVRLAAAAETDADLYRIDRLAWACRPTSEARKAQQQMGRQRLKLVAEISGNHRMATLQHAAEKNEWLVNWPAVWGAETACLSLDLTGSLTAYGYQTVNGILSASMKLIRIGPFAVQKIMRQIGDVLPASIGKSLEIAENDIGWFSPLLDIAGARHETAYSRLFIS